MKRTPFVHICLLVAFLVNSVITVPLVQAKEIVLPNPGVMVHLSPPENPAMLKGMKINPNNPFRFEFILDRGDSVGAGLAPAQEGQPQGLPVREESIKLIKYFLASLTIPEKDLWVNLSPYEKDRIVPDSFGLTEMGRDLLAQDYMLKQVTASLIYPEDEVGKKFWKRVYEEAAKKYGSTNIPVNTFNKVWIVPEKAVVYENAKAGTAYVVESKLKVMLEEDYLSLEKHAASQGGLAVSEWEDPHRAEGPMKRQASQPVNASSLGSQIVREIVIPELTKEVNEGKNFAQLRQVYNSLILATWYKKKIKDSILSKVYADKNKVQGLKVDDVQDKQKIYEQYLQAFKKGVYNYIKEDIDPATQERIPRKYFSGGWEATDLAMTVSSVSKMSEWQLSRHGDLFRVSASMSIVKALFAKPDVQEGEVPFKTLAVNKDNISIFSNEHEYAASINSFKILKELKDVFRRNQTPWNYSVKDEEGFAIGLGALVENLAQHEDLWFQVPYYRIYKTKDERIRVEFFGRGKHPLPKQLLDEGSGGKEYKWFGQNGEFPWNLDEKAPRSAVTGGKVHRGVSNMFEWFRGLVQVGWREVDNGHMIAVDFPIADQAMSIKRLENNAIEIIADDGQKYQMRTIRGEKMTIAVEQWAEKMNRLGVEKFTFRASQWTREIKKEGAFLIELRLGDELMGLSAAHIEHWIKSGYDEYSTDPQQYESHYVFSLVEMLPLKEIRGRNLGKTLFIKTIEEIIRQSKLNNIHEDIVAEPISEQAKAIMTGIGFSLSGFRTLRNQLLSPDQEGSESTNETHWWSISLKNAERILIDFYAFEDLIPDKTVREQTEFDFAMSADIDNETRKAIIKSYHELKGLPAPDFSEEIPLRYGTLNDVIFWGDSAYRITKSRKPNKEEIRIFQEMGQETLSAKYIDHGVVKLSDGRIFPVLRIERKQGFDLAHMIETRVDTDGRLTAEDAREVCDLIDLLIYHSWFIKDFKAQNVVVSHSMAYAVDVERAEKLDWMGGPDAMAKKYYDFMFHESEAYLDVLWSDIDRDEIIRHHLENRMHTLSKSEEQAQFKAEMLQKIKEREEDKAQISTEKKGGIDFNADKINLQIQNSGEGIKFKIDPAMLAQLQNAPGFTPVIINIQPLDNLRLFLGLSATAALSKV